MKPSILITALLSITTSVMADDYTGWQNAHPEWELVFTDDFNGSSLDTSKWNRIDYVNWNVADWRKFQSRDQELVTMNGDGTISLWGKYGDYTSQSDQTGDRPTYACGGIFTDKTFNFQYGYVEVRAKFDCAQGAWPAIWMMPVDGSNWPQNGEIDILEHLNYEGIAHQTLHFKNAAGGNTTLGTVDAAGRSTAYYSSVEDKLDYHTYGLEWMPEGISFLMDGKKTLTLTHQEGNSNWPFNKENNPYYLLLDMQLGGNWVGDIGDIGEGVAMTIDYVHVYSTSPLKVPEPTSAMLSLLAACWMVGRRYRK